MCIRDRPSTIATIAATTKNCFSVRTDTYIATSTPVQITRLTITAGFAPIAFAIQSNRNDPKNATNWTIRILSLIHI